MVQANTADASSCASDKQGTYNSAAVRISTALTEARAAAAPVQRDRPIDKRFPAFHRPGLGVALEYERMGNRPISEELEGRGNELGVRFEHLGTTLGSVIHGIDLKAAHSEDQARFFRDCLLERKVIFFRDQHLSEDEQVAFGRLFGDLDAFPFGRSGDNPFILEISHDKERPGTENGWHTDVTWMEKPSLGSIAQCIVAPPIGGDTLFSDSHAACLGLPEGIREQLENVQGINDYRLFLASRSLPEELIESIKEAIPFGVSHPLLRTHPETGKTGLYIHGGFLRHDSLYNDRTGEPLEKNDALRLVSTLLKQHDPQEYVCRFQWGPGSIAFWDNRAVQHYAASDYYPHERMIRRVTVSGDLPFYDADRAAVVDPT